jgi:UrcA family protein
MKINPARGAACLLTLATAAASTMLTAQSAVLKAFDVADLDLMTAAGRRVLDERLDYAVAAGCQGQPTQSPRRYQPGPGSSKGFFVHPRVQSARDSCTRDLSREAHLLRDRLVEQSALNNERRASR